jgi:predicted  nucleic acid-binding Zn-ribbon protein
MSTEGTTSASGRGRSLMGVVKAVPGTTGRVERLEAEVAQLQRRVDDLERNLAAVHAVRDEVRTLTETLTEELNRLARDAD